MNKTQRAKKRIELLRRIHGLKQREISEILGLGNYRYKQWLTNKSLRAEQLVAICDSFGLVENDLLNAEDSEFMSYPIFKAYFQYQNTKEIYENMKIGKMLYEDIEV